MEEDDGIFGAFVREDAPGAKRGAIRGADFGLLQVSAVACGDYFSEVEVGLGETIAGGMQCAFDGHDADGAATEEPDGEGREGPDGCAAKDRHETGTTDCAGGFPQAGACE